MSITSSAIGKRTYKVILLGDSSAGKTSIIQRFVNNKFLEKHNPTIGIDFLGKNVAHNNTTCRLQLWDTAGQQRYRSLIPSYLKDAVCAIFVFDVTRPQTLQNIQIWIDLFKNNKGQRAVMAICGNKSDLTKIYEQSRLKQVLDKNKMKYYQTSALNGDNIDNLFMGVIDDIMSMQQTVRKKVLTNEETSDVQPPPTTQKLFNNGKGQNEEDNEKIRLVAQQKKGVCC